MKKAEPENLIEALAALPESAWIKPRVLTADEKAMVAKLDLWARRAFGVSIGRFHNQAGVDVPNFDSIEGLVSFGIKHGVRLTQEGAAIADAAHLWKGHTQANTAGRGTAPGRKLGPSADVSHGFYGIADLATRNGIPEYRQGAFEKRLRRWRKDNALSGDVIEHDASCKNQARFLFRESAGAIQDIINLYAEKA